MIKTHNYESKEAAIMDHPITMKYTEACATLNAARDQKLCLLVGTFTKEILDKNPTPDEVQAVLVATWETVLVNARFGTPIHYVEPENDGAGSGKEAERARAEAERLKRVNESWKHLLLALVALFVSSVVLLLGFFV